MPADEVFRNKLRRKEAFALNTPNKLTLLRICLVPIFVLFLLWTNFPYHFIWALLIFIAASVTDAIDGHLARKHHLITDFGKFLDPLADKILVVSALVCFVEMGLCSAVVVVIVIAREFLVSALRLVAGGDGNVIAASIWGKLKTISQMIAVIYILAYCVAGTFATSSWDFAMTIGKWIAEILLWGSTVLTIISGADYLWKNRSCINSAK